MDNPEKLATLGTQG